MAFKPGWSCANRFLALHQIAENYMKVRKNNYITGNLDKVLHQIQRWHSAGLDQFRGTSSGNFE